MEKYRDYLDFKKMIVPTLIKILFWFGVAVCVIVGLIGVIRGATAQWGGGAQVITGILMVLFGPLVVRIYCELLIVIFKIHETLTEIKGLLKEK